MTTCIPTIRDIETPAARAIGDALEDLRASRTQGEQRAHVRALAANLKCSEAAAWALVNGL